MNENPNKISPIIKYPTNFVTNWLCSPRAIAIMKNAVKGI